MAEIRPLPIYPSVPTGDDLALLKEAKAKLDLPFMVKPVKAVPGSPGRIIAFREHPHFICDHAYIPNPNPTSILEALKWATSDIEDARAVTVVKMLQEVFGKGVKEIAISENPR